MVLFAGCRDTAPSIETSGRHIGVDSSSQHVNLLAMGDWGTGSERQQRVADRLKSYVLESGAKFDGILLAGDNFYVDLRGVDDPKWQTVFEQVYDPHVLSFPFFAALGNHDYEDDKDEIELDYAQANPQSRWKMPARWYRIDFPRHRPLVTVFMLDSNRDSLGPRLWQAQIDWLRNELQGPGLGTWVIGCAHHELFSNGDHGDIGPLQRAWGPIFQEYGVDFYVCGHDHDLQHLELPGRQTSFILCGGGGARPRPMRSDRRGPFSRSLNGFVHFSLTPRVAMVRFIDVDGNVVHAFVRDRQGRVSVLDSTGRDMARPRDVKSITRPDAATRPSTNISN